MSHPSSGVLAATITPLDEHGSPDFETFTRVLDFVIDRGVDGVVVGGGTGEYPHLSIEDRKKLAQQAVRRMNRRGKVLVSVGTSSVHSTLQLAKAAEGDGCDGLLVPMPYFFQYDQSDLAEFCRAVCRSVSLPCFLYNLPSFTNPLAPETAISLLQSVPNLVGIKDSSGSVSNLQQLQRARSGGDFSLFVGDDSYLLQALNAGWDGVISGIACFVPELIVALYRSFRSGDLLAAGTYQATLDAVINNVVRLPIPWGVRVGLEVRGIPNGPLHLPLSAQRLREIEALKRWLSSWVAERQLEPDQVWSTI